MTAIATPVASGLPADAWIDVPYADTRAADLSFAIGLGALPAIRARTLALAGATVELRILGCSHQVIVGGSTLGGLSETVACLAGGDGGHGGDESELALPARHQRDFAVGDGVALRYRMASRVESLANREDELDALVSALSTDPAALVGVFPGHALAFTGLRAATRGRGVAWETWHAYPQAGELVHTRTRLERVSS